MVIRIKMYFANSFQLEVKFLEGEFPPFIQVGLTRQFNNGVTPILSNNIAIYK